MLHRRPSRARTALALAAAVTAAGAGAGCGSAMQPGHSATTPTSAAAATTAATETAAVRTGAPVPTAQLLAVARRSVPGLRDATITSASVVTTTKEAAENWLEPGSVPATGSSPRAYLIVLRGRFVCRSCTRPAGASAPRGSSAQLIWIPGAGVTDFGLTPRVPTGLNRLGRVVRIYLGRRVPPHAVPPPPIRLAPAPVRAHPVTPSRTAPVAPVGMMNGTPVH